MLTGGGWEENLARSSGAPPTRQTSRCGPYLESFTPAAGGLVADCETADSDQFG